MKALMHEGAAGVKGLSVRETKLSEPAFNEVVVKMKMAGINHRDLFVLERHQSNEPPLIPGSDGAGVVEAVGNGVQTLQPGDEVIINPAIGWRTNSDAPPEEFSIIGHPRHGTFAEQVIVPSANVYPKPAHLTWEEAGVLSLSALTAYRALFTKGRARAGMKVLIPGIGGGGGTFLLQFAKAVGAVVYVTSRSAEKRRKALALGADKAIDSTEDWGQALGNEKVDLVVETVGAATFHQSLEQIRPGGTVVTYGASAGDVVELNLRQFFYGQFHLLGTTMGSEEEYAEMLHFIQAHSIRPVLDHVFALDQFQEAFERIETASQMGKVGLNIESA